MTKVAVRCWKCGELRWLRPCDAEKAERNNSPCRTCQRRAAGKRGYEVTVGKYGVNFFIECVARYQEDHQPDTERIVRAMLNDMGAAYETQVPFYAKRRRFIIDIVLPNNVAIEPRGYWHLRRLQERDELLASAWPGHVEFIDADTIYECPDYVRERLKTLIAMPVAPPPLSPATREVEERLLED
jgi:hypothetical protein